MYDITAHRKFRTGEWTDPTPPGGYHIPAFDPTIPSGSVVYGPQKGKKKVTAIEIPDVAFFRRIEEEMFSAEVCSSRIELESRMLPDFVEITSSGRIFKREEMIEILLELVPKKIVLKDFMARYLTPEVVLLNYRSDVESTSGGSPIAQIRSTIWCLENNQWRAAVHQATPTE